MYLYSLSARVLGKAKPNQPSIAFHRMIPEFSYQMSLCINSWLLRLFWGFLNIPFYLPDLPHSLHTAKNALYAVDLLTSLQTYPLS